MKREELKIRKRTINSVQRLVERDEQHEQLNIEIPAPKMGLFCFFFIDLAQKHVVYLPR
jgi:hypothetical protein